MAVAPRPGRRLRSNRPALVAAVVLIVAVAGTLAIGFGTGAFGFGNRHGAPIATSPTPTGSPPAAPSPGGSPVPTASPSPTTLPDAAVLVGFPNGDGPYNTGYDVSIVGVDGKTIATTHAPMRTHIYLPVISGPAAIYMPQVNVARNDVYYLSGDSEVRILARDGSTRAVTTIAGSSTAHAAFAISPDEKRIAVGVLDYSAGATHTPTGTAASSSVATHLYVEDLGTHTNHVEIFSSSTLHVWPIAWHSGQLVVAVGSPYSQQGIVMNPYSAGELHVVDAATAMRVATMGSAAENGCWPTGLLSAPGIACYKRTATSGGAGVITVVDWSGAVPAGSPSYKPGSGGGEASVSPDGARLAIKDGFSPVMVQSSAGTVRTGLATDPRAVWPCWIDGRHVMSSTADDSSPFQGAVPNAIVDLDTGKVVPTEARGMCAAVAPSAVE